MSIYPVHELKDKRRLVVILQNRFIDTPPSIIAAPLLPIGEIPHVPPITIEVELLGDNWLVLFQMLSATPKRLIGPEVGDLDNYDYAFQRAHQRLFFGN